uniref:Uncharacterized protein n=1 Tax=Oryza punctata TaxID=4537 RepID=A0A0E0KJ18_ORYPU
MAHSKSPPNLPPLDYRGGSSSLRSQFHSLRPNIILHYLAEAKILQFLEGGKADKSETWFLNHALGLLHHAPFHGLV